MEYRKNFVPFFIITSILIMVISGLIFCFFALGLVGSFIGSDPVQASFIIIVLIFLALSAAVFNVGRKRYGMMRRSAEYFTRLSADPERTLAQIALDMKIPAPVARKELNKLIRKQFFTGFYFNSQTDCIEIPGNAGFSQARTVNSGLRSVRPSGGAGSAEPAFKTVTCESCGASNVVPVGATSQCEYCGSPLQG